MNKQQALNKIAELIDRKPQLVISALNNSGVSISKDASDKEIVEKVTKALYTNKNFVRVFQPKIETKKFSNAVDPNLVAAAISSLANLGQKIGLGKEREHEMALAQQQTQAQLLAALANKKKESNLVPVIVIGGVFVIAAIVLVLTLKPKK
jgi:TRAP-type uncharacterized transport system substrate-binding protein